MKPIPLLALALAACTEAAPPPSPAEDGCGAAALADLVGQDASALAAMTFPDTTRFIRPGDAVTMDYSAERLNIDLGADGTILRLWCG
ncbi:MAG: I78 family peptidase inhibitor [Paracoccaceae bacterium]|nr:I78 family peptidase inhibitor [Paracoccaceae bacterium]